jgi:siroheme synthase
VGIPLTHRDCASSVTLATAHAQSEDSEAPPGGDVPAEGTLVFYMGLGRIEATCAALIAAGRAGDTPAAAVSRATLPDQRVVVGTLADVADRVRAAKLEAPALLIVGQVVARRVTSPATRSEGEHTEPRYGPSR